MGSFYSSLSCKTKEILGPTGIVLEGFNLGLVTLTLASQSHYYCLFPLSATLPSVFLWALRNLADLPLGLLCLFWAHCTWYAPVLTNFQTTFRLSYHLQTIITLPVW